MVDDRDTIVDPSIRREVERPRADGRRPVLLIAIVVTSALAGAMGMALLRGPSAAPAPRTRVTPVVAPTPPAPLTPPTPPAMTPPAIAPPPASASPAPPASHAGGPCIDYHQKGLGADEPRRVDCLSPR